MSDVADHIAAAAATKRRLFVSTANLNFLALSHRSPQFHDSLWASDLCTADGVAIVLLCRLLGIRIPQRVAGSDFIRAIANVKSASASRPLTVFFFGGTADAGPAACAAVNALGSPNLQCLGSLSPGFGSMEEMSSPETIATINAHDSDFLIVSHGAEKGQAWIMRNRSSLKAPVISHLGATINFLAGSVRRAPKYFQAAGLEWLWRIKEERHLAGRYWKDGIFFARLIVAKVVPLALWLGWNRWRWRNLALAISTVEMAPGQLTLKLSGAATRADVDNLEKALSRAGATSPYVSVDCSALKWADLHVMAVIAPARMAAQKSTAKVEVTGISVNLRRGMSLNGLDRVFGV